MDRLIPDLIRAVSSDGELEIRNPNATRPWQHVLESLSGYLLLGQHLLQGRSDFAAAWNFGSSIDSNRSVGDLLESVSRIWPRFNWHVPKVNQPHEAQLLYLDCSKALNLLDWKPVWDFNETLASTVLWYQAWLERSELSSRQQLISFISKARQKGMTWSIE
jgi:CDP-glucose 4,6-dehydratase